MPKLGHGFSPDVLKKLFQHAVMARQHAYCGYSGFAVGASVLFDDGSYSSGSNIENASYGATVCAERVAIWCGVKDNNKLRIKAICVVTDQKNPWPPCGLCLQIIAEFAMPSVWVFCGNLRGIKAQYRFSDLWEKPFAPVFLNQ